MDSGHFLSRNREKMVAAFPKNNLHTGSGQRIRAAVRRLVHRVGPLRERSKKIPAGNLPCGKSAAVGLLNFQPACGGNGRRGLWKHQLQNAVGIAGLDGVGLNAVHAEASGIGAVGTLTANEVSFFVRLLIL